MPAPASPAPLHGPDRDALVERAPGVRWLVTPMVGATAAYWEFEPDMDLARHNHPHAQLVAVFDGRIDLIFDDQTIPVLAGQTLAIPPHQFHGARVGPDGVRVVDVFVPNRDEYEAEYAAAREV